MPDFKLSTEKSQRGNDILVFRHEGKAIKFQKKDKRGANTRWRCVTCKSAKTPGERLIKVADGALRQEDGVLWQMSDCDPTVGHNSDCKPESIAAFLAEQSMRAASRDAKATFGALPSAIALVHEARIPALVEKEKERFAEESAGLTVRAVRENYGTDYQLANRLTKAKGSGHQSEEGPMKTIFNVPDRFKKTLCDQPFLMYESPEHGYIAFASDEALKFLGKCTEIKMDGTFKIAPRRTLQLYTILGKRGDIFMTLKIEVKTAVCPSRG